MNATTGPRAPRPTTLRPRILHVLDAGPLARGGLLESFGPPRSEPADAPLRACAEAIARCDHLDHTALLISGSVGERVAHTLGVNTLDRIVPTSPAAVVRALRRFGALAGSFDLVKPWSAWTEGLVREADLSGKILDRPAFALGDADAIPPAPAPPPHRGPVWTRPWKGAASDRARARARLGAADADFVVGLIVDPPDAADAYVAERVVGALEVARLRVMGVMPDRIRGRARAMRHARAFAQHSRQSFAATPAEILAAADAAVLMPARESMSDLPMHAAKSLAQLWWAAEAIDLGIPLVAAFSVGGGPPEFPGARVARLAPSANPHHLAAALIPIIEARAVPAPSGIDAKGYVLANVFFREAALLPA